MRAARNKQVRAGESRRAVIQRRAARRRLQESF
jgi:hypothetical protein